MASLRSRGIATVVVLCSLVAGVHGEEPSYAGKPTSWWIGELTAGDEARAEIARTVLRHIGAETLGPLSERLAVPSQRSRVLAVMVQIQGKPPPSALSLLIECLRDSGPGVRQDAARVISRAGADAEPALPALRWMLRERDSRDDGAALAAVAGIGPRAESAIPDILALLESATRDDFRARIATTLGRIGSTDVAAVDALLRLAADTTPHVRKEAIQAIGATPTKDPRAVAATRAACRDTDRDVRRAALQALVQQSRRDPGAVKHLLAVYDEAGTDLRTALVGAWGEFADDPRVLDALARALEDEVVAVRENAGEALGRLGAKVEPALPALVRALASPKTSRPAESALRKLRPLGTPYVLEALARGLVTDEHHTLALWTELTPTEVELLVAHLPRVLRDPMIGKEGRGRLIRVLYRGSRNARGLVPVYLAALQGADAEAAAHVGAALAKEKGSDELVRELARSSVVEERRAALEAVKHGALRSGWLGLAKRALRDADRDTRIVAAHVLAGRAEALLPTWAEVPVAARLAPELVPVLVEGTSHADRGVRELSAWGLYTFAAHAAEAVGTLEALLADPDPKIVEIAATTLGALPEGAGHPALRRALGSEKPSLRVIVAERAFGAFPEEAMDELIRALGEPETAVRVRALTTIATLLPAQRERVPPGAVVELMRSTDPYLRDTAFRTWTGLPATPASLKAVEDLLGLGVPPPAPLRAQVIRSLVLFDVSAVGLLVEILRGTSPTDRVVAANTLYRFGSRAREAAPALEAAAADPDATVAAAARAALAEITKPR